MSQPSTSNQGSSSEEIAKAAKVAFEASQLIPSAERIRALHAIKAELDKRKDEILAANREDLQVFPLLDRYVACTDMHGT